MKVIQKLDNLHHNIRNSGIMKYNARYYEMPHL